MLQLSAYWGTTIKSKFGNLSLGVDGSITYGNNFLSYGTSSDGKLIMDISIPLDRNSAIGTTIYFDSRNTNRFLNQVGGFFDRINTYHVSPLIPPRIIIP